MFLGLVISEWAKADQQTTPCPPNLVCRLHQCFEEFIYFDEIAHSFTRLAQETKDFLATLRHYKVPITVANDNVLTLEQIKDLTGPQTHEILVNFKLKSKVLESLEERRKSIQTSVTQTNKDQNALYISTLGKLIEI